MAVRRPCGLNPRFIFGSGRLLARSGRQQLSSLRTSIKLEILIVRCLRRYACTSPVICTIIHCELLDEAPPNRYPRPPNFLGAEPEYWGWLREISAKTGASLKDIIEAIAATRNYHRSLASEIRVAVAAYFHGNPYPIYRCPGGMVPMRDGSVLLGWPGGRRRAQDGRRSTLVDQAHGTQAALGQPLRFTVSP